MFTLRIGKKVIVSIKKVFLIANKLGNTVEYNFCIYTNVYARGEFKL